MSTENGNESYIFFDKDTAFTGDVITDHLVLEGVITGVVLATRKVYLRSGSVVHGEITTWKYLVEDGSIHDGKLRLNDNQKNSREAGCAGSTRSSAGPESDRNADTS